MELIGKAERFYVKFIGSQSMVACSSSRNVIKNIMLKLSNKWVDFLNNQPETGMGYQVVSVIQKSGMRYDRVIVDSGYITRVKDISNIPFTVEEIEEIIVTHDKWNFN